MFAMFVMVAVSLVFGGSEYEACKADDITNVKVCAERSWESKEALNYSKLND